MRVRLDYIPNVGRNWELAHEVRALSIHNGTEWVSPALHGLNEWRKKHPEDFRKILKAVRFVAGNWLVRNVNHVKKVEGYPDLYEMRAHKGHARLLFFYEKGTRRVVICTNCYWKAKTSRSEQDRSFRQAQRLKEIYEASSSS